MSLFRLKRVFLALLFSSVLAATGAPHHVFANTVEGIQIEFPDNGQLRVENYFGSIAAESWQQKYILVATTEGAVASRRTSVVIENKNQRFVIRVVRRPGAPEGPIDLSIKIPESARLEVVTSGGRVSLRGMPSSASVKSVAGDVQVEFWEPANVDISAQSARGIVKSELPRLFSDNGHVLQARLGTGAQSLKINSETGNIALGLSSDSRNNSPASEGSDRLGNEGPTKAAGTPAPVLDAQDISEGDVVRVDSQLVTLNMSVIDRNTSRGVVGLTQSDFRLFENGNEQRILQFDSSSAPFDLLLLIDLSGSTRDKVKLIRAAALRFVEAARPYDRIGVITFAGQASVVSGLTLDRALLRERISEVDTAPGDTKLYDAMEKALIRTSEDRKNRRRTAIILMSDGLDNSIPGVQGEGSKLEYRDLLNRINEFDGVLYTLWLNTEYESLSPLDTQPEAFDAAYDRMKEMADTGGGIFYEVERLEDLSGAYERVVADLGTVYSLAYRPSDKARDGKWRAIRVNVAARPSAIARGKRGYYAN